MGKKKTPKPLRTQILDCLPKLFQSGGAVCLGEGGLHWMVGGWGSSRKAYLEKEGTHLIHHKDCVLQFAFLHRLSLLLRKKGDEAPFTGDREIKTLLIASHGAGTR